MMTPRRLLLSLAFLIGLTLPADAANLYSAVTGNLTAAGTWVTSNTGTNAVLVSSSTGTTALTTSNLDSATFTPAAQASQYLAVRVGARAAGSPTNKMTVILRDSTSATDIWTFVVNVSDLPICTTSDDQCGWIVLKAAASTTPNGTDTYLVRSKLDSTSTAVSLSTNGTANNWQRQLFRTLTAAPAAGDDMLIAQWFDTTNPAVATTVTVTMDQTAATDYGSNTTNYRTAALNICKGGSLTYGTTASTNYILQLSGWLVQYSGGTYTQDTSGVSSATTTLQFDGASDESMGFDARSGTVVVKGFSKTTPWTTLSADAAAAATTLTTTDTTGWKNGDSISIAATTQTLTQTETRTLSGDASGTSVTISVGLTNAHGGSASTKVQAEVLNLTRTATIKSVTAGNMIGVVMRTDTAFTFQWMAFVSVGRGTYGGLSIQTTSGTGTVQDCYFSAGELNNIEIFSTFAGTVTIDNNVFLDSINVTFGVPITVDGTTASTWSITNNVMVMSAQAQGMTFASLKGTITGNRVVVGGEVAYGVAADLTTSLTSGTFSNNIAHSCAGAGSGRGFWAGLNGGTHKLSGFTITNFVAWRNKEGIRLEDGAQNVTIDTPTLFGNTTANLTMDGSSSEVKVLGGLMASDTTFTSVSGIAVTAATVPVGLNLFGTTLGHATGIYTAHTNDVNVTGSEPLVRIRANNVSFESATEVTGLTTAAAVNSYITSQKHDQTAGTHKTFTPYGIVAIETSTVDVTPAVRLTPSSASVKLDSAAMVAGHGFLVAVTNAQAPTISVKVRKDATYNGNSPRLILKRNDALGFTADVVLNTCTVSSASFTVCSGTPSAATDDGVEEVVVDADGTAGYIIVDTWSVTNAQAFNGGERFWSDGYALDTLKRGSPTSQGQTYWLDGRPFAVNAYTGAGGPVGGPGNLPALFVMP